MKILKERMVLYSILIFTAVFMLIFLLNRRSLFEHLSFLNSGYRQTTILKCDNGFIKSKQHLLMYIEDHNIDRINRYYAPLENIGDDLGIYYYVVKIKDLFQIESTQASYNVFCISIIFISFIVSITGCNLLFKKKKVKIAAFISIGIYSIFTFFIMDVYVMGFLTVSFVPLIIYCFRYLNELKFYKIILLFSFIGLILGIANNFRNHTGTGILIFTTIMLIFSLNKQNWSKLTLLFLILLLTNQFENFHFNQLKESRDKWISQKNISSRELLKKNQGHLLWHPLYLGLAFTPNKYGIKWSDKHGYDIALKKEQNIKIDFYNCGDKYEKIIKNEFINIVAKDPIFVIKTYFIKLLYVLLFLLPCFNIAPLLFFKIKINRAILISILSSIAFYSIPAVLVWPFPMYFLPAMFMAILLSLIYFEKWIDTEKKQ